MRHDTIKLLEESIGKTFSDINHTNVFLGHSAKAIEIKTKIIKWDLIKLKTFYTTKETINKMKRQSTEWETIICKLCNLQGLNFQSIQIAYNSITKKQTTKSKNGQKT